MAEEPPPSPAVQARVFLLKGNMALRKGDEVMAREYYRKSFEFEEGFDAMCNLGGVEARSKMFAEAYEHLQLCLQIYPDDPDLAETREKIVESKNAMRLEISTEEARAAEIRVVEYMNTAKQPVAEETPPEAVEPEPKTEPVPPPDRRSARGPVTIGVGVAGLIGIGIGTAFQLKAAGHRSDAETLRSEIKGADGVCMGADAHESCGDLSDKVDRAKSARVVRSVGFVSGGALIVGSVLTYLLWPRSAPERATTFTPWLRSDVDGLSLGVRGHF